MLYLVQTENKQILRKSRKNTNNLNEVLRESL